MMRVYIEESEMVRVNIYSRGQNRRQDDFLAAATPP